MTAGGMAHVRPTVIDGTATERPMQFAPPVRATRPTLDSRQFLYGFALLLVVVAFAGLMLSL